MLEEILKTPDVEIYRAALIYSQELPDALRLYLFARHLEEREDLPGATLRSVFMRAVRDLQLSLDPQRYSIDELTRLYPLIRKQTTTPSLVSTGLVEYLKWTNEMCGYPQHPTHRVLWLPRNAWLGLKTNQAVKLAHRFVARTIPRLSLASLREVRDVLSLLIRGINARMAKELMEWPDWSYPDHPSPLFSSAQTLQPLWKRWEEVCHEIIGAKAHPFASLRSGQHLHSRIWWSKSVKLKSVPAEKMAGAIGIAFGVAPTIFDDLLKELERAMNLLVRLHHSANTTV